MFSVSYQYINRVLLRRRPQAVLMDVPAAQHGWRAVESTADARAGSTAKVYYNRCHPFAPDTLRYYVLLLLFISRYR